MKMKKTAVAAFLCLLFCFTLLPVSAFADQTLVIVGGALQQDNAAVVTQGSTNSQGSTVITSGSTSVVSGVSTGNGVVITGSQTTESSSASVIIMPNGTVVAPQGTASGQAAQAAQSGQTAVVTESASTVQTASTQQNGYAPAGLVTEIFNRINQVRSQNGLGILGYDNKLQATADLRAEESSRVFGHTRPDGSAAVTAVTVDYNVAGENLIQVTEQYATVDIIVETWLASETHKANILLSDFTQTAIGVYEHNGVFYISQIFTD